MYKRWVLPGSGGLLSQDFFRRLEPLLALS
jgi:hypothetical protein